MKVILRKDVNHLGRTGDIKEVADGYARNYLLPKGLVEVATPGAVKNWELGAEQRKKRVEKEDETAKKQIEKMKDTVLSFTRAVGKTGQLFGSVGRNDIVKSMKASGFEISSQVVELEHPIKAVGESEVTLTLRPGISTKIKVRIVAHTS
jgi:large subunit ribosomal protein L9